jgi:hypothetical protein
VKANQGNKVYPCIFNKSANITGYFGIQKVTELDKPISPRIFAKKSALSARVINQTNKNEI